MDRREFLGACGAAASVLASPLAIDDPALLLNVHVATEYGPTLSLKDWLAVDSAIKNTASRNPWPRQTNQRDTDCVGGITRLMRMFPTAMEYLVEVEMDRAALLRLGDDGNVLGD